MNSLNSETQNAVLTNGQKISVFKNRSILNKLAVIFMMLAIYIVLNIISQGRFLSASNIRTVISHAIIPTFVSWGLCFIFTTGITDLSVGSIMILASNVSGLLAVKYGYFGLIVGGVVTALVLEFINLKCYLKLNIPSWVSGLGMAMVYEAIGAFYSAARVKAGAQVIDLGDKARLLGLVPYSVFAWMIGLVLGYILYNRSAIGLNIRAVGSNESVSKMMGVETKKAVLLGGIVGGIFIGLASAINESYAGRVMPVTGLNSVSIIFIPLAAFLLAQAFQNTFNLIVGVMLSSVLVSSIFNILTMLGVPSGTWQEIVLGGSVIVFGILSQRHNKGVAK